jgi:hypothetical protein
MFEMSPEHWDAFRAIFIGFAFAGLLASLFRLVTHKAVSFVLLRQGGVVAVACVPLIMFSAPFIILRNTLRGRQYEQRHVFFVMVATVIASFWSMAAGRVLLDYVLHL